ncbi:hypothetical protein ACG04Q_17075 [Roseateles sp. DXS20W]|uniref:Uncharacterized protein n=1 Tax=Pelomonas lactea TaxID=3299030 RepID=A0ABW7GMU1_9BURK
MRAFGIALVAAVWVSGSFAEVPKELPCEPNGECSDPCIYFPDGTVFVATESGAKLYYNKQVRELPQSSTQVRRGIQGNAELPGFVRFSTYNDGSTRVEATFKVTGTSCYEKNQAGIYESTDKCCWTEYDVTLQVSQGSAKKSLRAKWSSGC